MRSVTNQAWMQSRRHVGWHVPIVKEYFPIIPDAGPELQSMHDGILGLTLILIYPLLTEA